GLPRQRIPEVSRSVIARGGNLVLVGRPGDAIDRLRVTGQRKHELASCRVPNTGGRIPTCRDDRVTTGRPGDAMKRMRMGKREQGSPGRRIPNASSSIPTGCCDEAVIGRPRGSFDAFRVACQGEQQVTRLSVPNAGGSVLAGGG